MARTWTPSQASAIEETQKTLLVSAAAGSGKTAVLTERIVRALTDEKHPVDVNRMLIVTFTRAAAAEMRKRIADKLTELAAGRHSAHISRQLLLLPGAYICTIDSFCLDLVRAHAASLGISPAFRISDNTEGRLLQHSVMDRLVEECYGGTAGICEDAAFCSLVDCLSGGRDDKGLAEALLSLYDKTLGFAGTYRILFGMVEKLREGAKLPPFSTPWGAYLREETAAAVRTAMFGIDRHMQQVQKDAAAEKAFLSAFTSDLEQLSALTDALEVGYAKTRERLYGFTRAAIGRMKTEEKTEESEDARAFRDDFYKKTLGKLKKQYAYTEGQWEPCLTALADKLELVARLIEEFARRTEEEKRRRSVFDFGDIAHYALRLLTEEDGTPTPLALEVRRDFDWVYVDEYQDVNEVQHRIFEALSGARNRFMVGDVKQSIYGFRGAQPGIFADVRRTFPPLAAAQGQDAATVSLSANFRSAPNILDFVNLIFGRLMEGVGEAIDYHPDEDELNPGDEKAPKGKQVSVTVFEKTAKKKEDEKEADTHKEGEAEPDAEDGEDGEESFVSDAEALWVAEKIRSLLREHAADEVPLRPCDIAILSRKNGTLARYAAALDALGIQNEMTAHSGFFLNPEILLALSLLNTVDNPRRDVHLAGLLRSPIYRFTMDELYAVRREAEEDDEYKKCTLYEALCRYAAYHGEGKVSRFLADLAEFRRMAESTPVDRLIWHMYQKTGLLTLAGGNKEGDPVARRANLMLLYDYARKYEAASYHGLYSFIAYVNEAIERGQSFEESGKMSDRTDTVRLLSIHQSKGLEWRVCFVVDCGRGFNFTDVKKPLLFDGALGCALRLRDETGFARLNNPVYNAVSGAMRAAAVEEESRILYVALTRPKEQLFVTATVPEKMMDETLLGAMPLTAGDVHGCTNYAAMIAKAISGNPRPSYTLTRIPVNPVSGDPCVVKTEKTEEIPTFDKEKEEELFALFSERFAFDYPHRHLGTLPSKLSVSRLYPTVLDVGEEEVPLLGGDGEAEFTPVRPRFLDGETESAADAGTATHLFMQFCDFARLAKEGAAAELARLTEGHFIPEEKAKLVRLDEIERFRASNFLAEILRGEKLYRELRFNVRLPAADFTADPDLKEAYSEQTVLVQGVMDGVLVDGEGRITLFDYKTDRLTGAELKNRSLAEKKLLDRHRMQLGYYVAACRHIFGKNPDRVAIYSLPLGDTVDLPPEEFAKSSAT